MKLFKFGAAWCQPCKVMDATLDRVLRDFPNVEVVRVDIDQQPALANEHNVRSVPTLITDTGRRLQGNISETAVRRLLTDG